MRNSAGAEGGRSVRTPEREVVGTSWVDEEVELRRYARLLRRYWIVLLAAVVAGAIVGLAITARRPLLYQAAATVLMGRVNVPANVVTSRALLENQTLVGEALVETGTDVPPLVFLETRLQ